MTDHCAPDTSDPTTSEMVALVSFRVTVDQARSWREAARRDGRTLSGWVRRVCDLAVAEADSAAKRSQ